MHAPRRDHSRASFRRLSDAYLAKLEVARHDASMTSARHRGADASSPLVLLGSSP